MWQNDVIVGYAGTSAAETPRRDAVARHAFHRLPVGAVIEETNDTRTYVFDVPAELSETYRYEPGQFCTVRATIDGDQVSRCYSMSSAPLTDDRLALTVKRVPGGRMSNWLVDAVEVGTELELMPPAGHFCERPGDGPILLFCGGSGVTPVFSILKQVLARGDRRVRLLDANRDADAVIFRAELDRIAATHGDRCSIRHHLDGESGFLTPDDVAAFVGADVDADVFICGPAPFMDLVEEGVARAGVPTEQVAIERFVDDGDVSHEPATTATSDDRSAAEGTTARQLTIRLKRRKHRIEYVAGDTILEAARRGGLAPPFSCLQGDCATCMALVHEGTVQMRANNVLTDAELDEGWVLTCQGLPTSAEVSIEYEDL